MTKTKTDITKTSVFTDLEYETSNVYEYVEHRYARLELDRIRDRNRANDEIVQ
mgnify:CR=1 FL=1